ncbi:hypothetical protein HDU97_000504 [Phlyctochytrium planicorne]|nr:hypothetical protein HDU97_000504 [Phlyctochytrium planicorne]
MKAGDLILRIRAGPDYDPEKLRIVNVNDEKTPLLIESEHFVGYLVVRMLNFNGVTPEGPNQQKPISNPESTYFTGRHRRYSIMLQGRWRKAWNGDDVVFGMDCASKVRTPPGVGLAVKIAKWLDPGLDVDLTCDEPWVYSSFVSAMNSMAIYPLHNQNVWDIAFDAPSETQKQADGRRAITFTRKKNTVHPPQTTSKEDLSLNNSKNVTITFDPASTPYPQNLIGKWSYHSRMMPEDSTLLFDGPESQPPQSLNCYEKRKRYFADQKARKAVTISPDHIYCVDFYDAYFDFNNVSLRLPGFSVNALRYFDGQPLRFACRSKDRSATFFTVHFELLERAKLGLAETVAASQDSFLSAEDFSTEELPPPEILNEAELMQPTV